MLSAQISSHLNHCSASIIPGRVINTAPTLGPAAGSQNSATGPLDKKDGSYVSTALNESVAELAVSIATPNATENCADDDGSCKSVFPEECLAMLKVVGCAVSFIGPRSILMCLLIPTSTYERQLGPQCRRLFNLENPVHDVANTTEVEFLSKRVFPVLAE
ncbi:hypothetical protein TruAng_006070 [Truncatella angustata]|nr:hypothetical protein TruAng_006070 [Truncatella angustata]